MSHILGMEEIQRELSDIASSTAPPAVRLKALDQLARTHGGYTDVQKIESTVQMTYEERRETLLTLLREEGLLEDGAAQGAVVQTQETVSPDTSDTHTREDD